jgi:hypothetical protein
MCALVLSRVVLIALYARAKHCTVAPTYTTTLALLTVNLSVPNNPPNCFAHKEGICYDYLCSNKKRSITYRKDTNNVTTGYFKISMIDISRGFKQIILPVDFAQTVP